MELVNAVILTFIPPSVPATCQSLPKKQTTAEWLQN